MKKISIEQNLIPSHQFGFRNKHATIEQIHRLINEITHTPEHKQYCTALFVDIEKAFDKVWHEGLLHKIDQKFRKAYYKLIKSYLKQRTFFVKCQDECSDIYDIEAGVPQGSTTQLYYLPTMTQRQHINLQQHIIKLEEWSHRWKIKVNTDKCKHITFTLKKGTISDLKLNNTSLPQTKSVKYLGLHLDSKLTWEQHIRSKINQIRIKRRNICWLTCKRSKLSLDNKLLIYKTIIKPIWTYGIEMWGMAAKSHIAKIESLQSIILRTLTNAPCLPRRLHRKHPKDLLS
ncbi:RNA-directed DNA polymerase from mobile element jockey [Anthophora plagiata]